MKKGTLFGKWLVLVLLVLGSVSASAIHYRLKHFGLSEGLPQTFVYTLQQDTNGYLWMGTGEGLCRFDGLKFEVFTTDDSLAEDFVNKLFLDSRGRMWIGHNQGGISVWENGRFSAIDTKGAFKSAVTDILEGPDGTIWVSTSRDGVLTIDEYGTTALYQLAFNKKNIYSMAIYGGSALFIGSNTGVYQYALDADGGSPEEVGLVSSLPFTKVNCLRPSLETDAWWLGTEDEGLYLMTVSGGAEPDIAARKVGESLELEMVNLQDVFEGPDHHLWLSTFGSGVLKLSGNDGKDYTYTEAIEYNESSGLSSNYTKHVLRDHEGNVWIATYGGGVAQIVDDHFSFYSYPPDSIDPNFVSVLTNGNKLWVGQNSGLVALDPRGREAAIFYGAEAGLPDALVTNLCMVSDSDMMVATLGEGLFHFDLRTEKFRHIALSEDRLSLSVASVVWDGSNVWVGTSGGLFSVNFATNEIAAYTTTNGLMHNSVNHLLIDSRQRLWVATNTPYLTVRENGEFQHIQLTSGGELLNGTCIAEDENGLLWLGTNGQGVFSISDDLIINYNSTNGLKSNYCYSLISDGKSIWVGHRQGLSRIHYFKDVVRAYDKTKGFTNDCNPNAVYRSATGTIWFGTSSGAIRFEPSMEEENTVPPIINFGLVKFGELVLNAGAVNELPYGAYKARVEFTGLSFSDPENVTYQYKLDGHDLEWSEASTLNFAQYNRLEDGKFRFLLRACNSDGYCTELPAEVIITVSPPLWKRWWFITLVALALLYAVYAVFRLRERTHRKRQEYLQSELDKRTREVVAQKEDIERKNKDITDSITYALRIQTALMPNPAMLSRLFEEAFIFYRPRDIVSGDFFWFEQIGDKRLVMAADCTGHGVPGSLVSMIGATLLKDICNREQVQSPADLLQELDKEMAETLHNEESDIHTQDGMDIVAAEISDDGTVRISSAMRPFFIRHTNGELVQYRGDRYSIGGGLQNQVKVFENQVFKLEPGSTIYLFSDGYPDQFGGNRGKKLKMKGLRDILESIDGVPVKEQGDAVGFMFEQWKLDHPQIDDVLFMGIKV